ncbi:hypothetical protein [Parasphingorhabdus sp.]|uniref:hypothetical protein n=1 Tax=Parasphingorhabdus sp. TaxID=2709688 RepID=UPI003BB1A3F6
MRQKIFAYCILVALPSNIRPSIEAFQTHFAPTEHDVVGDKTAKLMNERGLTGFLQDFDAIAGPEPHMSDVVRKPEAMGVSTLIAALLGHGAPLPTISGLAAAREAL